MSARTCPFDHRLRNEPIAFAVRHERPATTSPSLRACMSCSLPLESTRASMSAGPLPADPGAPRGRGRSGSRPRRPTPLWKGPGWQKAKGAPAESSASDRLLEARERPHERDLSEDGAPFAFCLLDPARASAGPAPDVRRRPHTFRRPPSKTRRRPPRSQNCPEGQPVSLGRGRRVTRLADRSLRLGVPRLASRSWPATPSASPPSASPPSEPRPWASRSWASRSWASPSSASPSWASPSSASPSWPARRARSPGPC